LDLAKGEIAAIHIQCSPDRGIIKPFPEKEISASGRTKGKNYKISCDKKKDKIGKIQAKGFYKEHIDPQT
tara:strand:+ start:730 stop:939 length:210 start_codon:yes stop_codon:yes gene_type:complete